MSFLNRLYNNNDNDSDSDISEASTIPDNDLNTEPGINTTQVQQPDHEGPNKVFTIVGCAIIAMFILKEILTIATLWIMLNLLSYAVDPVNTRELHKLNVAAAKQLHHLYR